MRSGLAILKRVVREGLTVMVAFVKTEGGEGAGHVDVWVRAVHLEWLH